MAAVSPSLLAGAQIGRPQFAGLHSTVLEWPGQDSESDSRQVSAKPKAKKKPKAKAKKAPKYDVRGHRVRNLKEKEKRLAKSDSKELDTKEREQAPAAPSLGAPSPPRRCAPASAMLAMARPVNQWPRTVKSMEKLTPLKELSPPEAPVEAPQEEAPEEKVLAFDEMIKPRVLSRSSSVGSLPSVQMSVQTGASRGSYGPLRRDMPVPPALGPESFQRRTRRTEATVALRQLKDKIRNPLGFEEKRLQLGELALRDLRADISHMLRRPTGKLEDKEPVSVDDVFGSQPPRKGKKTEVGPESRPSSRDETSPVTSTSLTSPSVKSLKKGASRLREGVSFELLPSEEEPNAGEESRGRSLWKSALSQQHSSGRSGSQLDVTASISLKGMSTGRLERSIDPGLRKRLLEAFSRRAESKELHREDLPAALGMAGWAVTKEIRLLIEEAYDSLFQYNTMTQNEFLQFFEHFQALEKQRAFEAFQTFDADGSGTIDFEELGALLESQGIFPLHHVIYELACEACGGLVESLDFAQFQRILEILREREGFTREERAVFEDAFDKCDSDGSGSLDAMEIGRVLAVVGFSQEMKFEELLEEVDVEQKNQLTKQDFLVFMRKIRERDTQYIRDYFRECDTDGEPGLDAKEIATLIESLGHVPDMACVTETLQQLNIENPEEDLDFSQVWRFLEVFRRQQGLTLEAAAEARATFRTFAGGAVSVSVDKLFQMIRSMGFDLHYHEIRKLMYLLEVNTSGSMNEQEFIRVVGHLKDTELRQMWKVVNEEPRCEPAKQLKQRFEETVLAENAAKAVTFMDFIPWASELRKKQREEVRRHHGFGKEEVEAFRQDFKAYAHADGIRPSDLRRLLTEKFPMLADKNTMQDHRARLSEVLGGTASSGLVAFLALARICHDFIEASKLKRERQAIQDTGFADAEVDEFRTLFMGQASPSGLPGSFSYRLAFDDVKLLLHNVVPLGHKNVQVLRKQVRLVNKHGIQGDDSVNFPEFLHLLRRLLDANFAGIARLGHGTQGRKERRPSDRRPSEAAT
ncbi:unnamed protein product [Effrenium voratum]|nr:unnamed protein product [Effrenium voratum]